MLIINLSQANFPHYIRYLHGCAGLQTSNKIANGGKIHEFIIDETDCMMSPDLTGIAKVFLVYGEEGKG